MLWSLLPVLQLCVYERAKLGSLLALKFLTCYHFEAFKIFLCGLCFLHIIFTEGCIITSKTRQILMSYLCFDREPEKGLYLKRWTGGFSVRFRRAGSWSHNHLSHQLREIHQKHLPLQSHPPPLWSHLCYPSQDILLVSLSPPSHVLQCTNPDLQAL